jgi:hypothetical protein
VVRTMGLSLIELGQEKEVLKPYHRCMLSKPRVQTASCHAYSSAHELFKYRKTLTVQKSSVILQDSIRHVQLARPMSVRTRARAELMRDMHAYA